MKKAILYLLGSALLLTNCLISAASIVEHRRTQEAISTISTRIDSVEQNYAAYSESISKIEEDISTLKVEVEALKVSPMTAAYDGKIDRNTDLAVGTEINVIQMNQIIDYWAEKNGGSAFVGRGATFIKAAQITNLDPIYLLAHSGWETGWGTSNIAITKNNYFGISAYDWNPGQCAYTMGSNVDEGIINGACWIKDNYYDQGCTSLYLMIYGPKDAYASAEDEWIDNIVDIMNVSYSIIM